MTDGGRFDVETLRQRVEQDAGGPEFPALAEALRRAGQMDEARRISAEGLARSPGRLAGRVSLGLALLELGDAEGAKRELAGILDSVLEPYTVAPTADEPLPGPTPAPTIAPLAEPLAALAEDADEFPDAVGDAELEQAFASAEPQVEEMFSANDMAERVLMDHSILDGEDAEDIEMGAGTAYGTETMAALLERQGDRDRAQAIRRSLGGSPEAATFEAASDAASRAWVTDAAALPAARADEAELARRSRILGTLETWLHNIQRGLA